MSHNMMGIVNGRFSRFVKSVWATVLGVLLFSMLPVGSAHAGFLEMPDIEEVPEAENDILLEDLDIPNVRERNPNPEAGPRLNVKSFRVQGIVEFPELGITRESLIKLVENIRFDIMKEGDRTEHGYTLEELAELQDIIADIEKDTRGEHVTQLDVQRLVFLIREQRRKRGVTLGMLESVADKITDYYRERGFILARAFIPQQHVRDGVVTITLLLGNLGEVSLENNTRYSQELMESVFSDFIGQPVTQEVIEEKLYHVNDFPGIAVQGFFSPGDQVGDTKLNINVLSEKTFSYNVRADNHGSKTTGEYRLYADMTFNSPFKYGDRLHIAALGAAIPETATYGAIRYGGPFFSYRWHYDIGVSQNAYLTELKLSETGAATNPKLTISEVGGKATTVDASMRYKIARSRVKSTSVGLRIENISAIIEIKDGNGDLLEGGANEDEVINGTLFYDFDFVRERKRSIHNGGVKLVSSTVVKSAQATNSSTNPETGEDLETTSNLFEDSQLLRFNYSYLKFFRFPFTQTDVRGKLTFQGQYSGKNLISTNQYSMGGPSKARAFSTSEFFADDGINISAELVLNRIQLGSKVGLQPYLFVDGAAGQKNTFEDDSLNQKARLIGVGAGGNFDFFKSFSGNVSLGMPIKGFDANEDSEKDGFTAYASFQYSF